MTEELKAAKIKLDKDAGRKNLLGSACRTALLRSGQVTLQQGEEVGEHNTSAREEAIIILSGSAEVSTGKGESFMLARNEMCYIPPDTVHNVRNIGGEALEYVYIAAPVLRG